jgi:hypothetical protein
MSQGLNSFITNSSQLLLLESRYRMRGTTNLSHINLNYNNITQSNVVSLLSLTPSNSNR